MTKLDRGIRIIVLTEVVACDFHLEAAAKRLGLSRAGLYRMFSRWKIPTPVGGNPGSVRFSEYMARCERIRKHLDQLKASDTIQSRATDR